MSFLQSVDTNNALVLVIACICLCGLGFVLITSLHMIGSVLGIVTSFFDIFFNILGGGPLSWCGCLLVLAGCIGVVGLGILLAQALATCGTAQAINFCSILGQ